MGYEFETMSTDFDEKTIRHDDPEQLTLALAHAKADALLPHVSNDALVITADTVVLCNGNILEKPESPDEARSFYKEYGVHPVIAVGAIVVTNTKTGIRVAGTDRVAIHLRPIPETVVEALISYGAIFNCAGGFTLWEPLLKDYINRVDGEVESAVGLSPTLTQRLIEEARTPLENTL